MAWVPAESAVEELMPRLLPVEPCDLTEGFDPSVPPRTPQEYLRRVQIEAAQCPDVVVAQIDPKKLKRKQSVNISLSGCQPAPEGYSPTLQWQQQQVAHFSTVRQSVHKHRNHWKSQQLDSNVAMPKSEDEEGWKNFVWVKGYVLKGPLDRLQRKALGSIMYKLVFLLCLVL